MKIHPVAMIGILLVFVLTIFYFAFTPKADAGDQPDKVLQNPSMTVQLSTTWEAKSFGQTVASCPDGTVALGGGWTVGPTQTYRASMNPKVHITTSTPSFNGIVEPQPRMKTVSLNLPDQWVVQGFNKGKEDVDIRTWVVCAEAADGQP